MKYPKPYTCEYSRTETGMNILCDEVVLLFVPFLINKQGKYVHEVIVDALNGAFTKGMIYESTTLLGMIKEKTNGIGKTNKKKY